MNRPVGIFGGTFDPIHFGHLRPALELHESLGLAETRFLPAGIPPHRDPPVASAEQRLAMVRLAVAGVPGFTVDERELRRPGPSRMVDTLVSLRDELGDRPLCLLLGADAFLGLPEWHRWEELIGLAHIVVAHRPGWSLESAPQNEAVALWRACGSERVEQLTAASAGSVLLQPVTQLAIAATALRRLAADGRSLRFMVPEPVRDYIEQEKLYLRDVNGR